MRQRGSDRLLIVGFIALAVGSVALKAAAGPARDGFSDPDPGQIAERFESTLRSQNFVAVADAHDIQHSNVLARRGNCRLSVRDARGAESFEPAFARDASSIGA